MDESVWDSEQVITCRDEQVGLRAVVAVDDTTLGPGFGGVRFRAYPDAAAAVREAQRLARAMTFKHALAELPYGGAKSVIIDDDPGRGGDARARLVSRFGEFVARLGGTYIPGVDMGTTMADMAVLADQGAKVYCARHDPAPWTARGVFAALDAATRHTLGVADLTGVTVSVQGAGSVGGALAELAAGAGATVLLSDVDPARAAAVAERIGAQVVDPRKAPFVDADVFAPCAVARVIGRSDVPRLRARVVAGAANDVLDTPDVAAALVEAGVTFVPDFVANAGGVIHEHARAMGWGEDRLAADVDRIGERTSGLLEAAQATGSAPVDVVLDRGRAVLARARAAHRHRE
ncbi:Glu/Leu/Phe/Val dehydrogenase dimerization domain-containing protein [Agilicoccus flavus]|uniref:Glu/Leu/Phe/Val dehydrogenase dimerization domain-containing protein n=1 Tax=Agilicoccus flavus TaxID=2775968 RepID=UPI001CF61AA3|nr:Glu/Leu/Phe/Val dehydrogenase dimerization domain-containing protein [Agilicoccus flavus]